MPAHMVLSPKNWYREIEHHHSAMEELLSIALEHSLPHAPFLAITAAAFDVFCDSHSLSRIDRKHSFPLSDTESRTLANSCKRLDLPTEFVSQFRDLFRQQIKNNPSSLMSATILNGDSLDSQFVGDTSALAAIRQFWCAQIAHHGVAKTRAALRKNPLFVVAFPKHAFMGELALKDKLMVNFTLGQGQDSPDSASYYLDLTSNSIFQGNSLSLAKTATRFPFPPIGLIAISRGLYRKSLFKHVCYLAGNKKNLWIQPTQAHFGNEVQSKPSPSAHPLIIAKGEGGGHGIAVGQVILVKSEKDWRKVRSSHIVVTSVKLKNFKQISLKMKALVSESPLVHASVSSFLKELRYPVIFGVQHITKLVKNGQVISLDAAKGTLYQGNIFLKSSPPGIPNAPTLLGTVLYAKPNPITQAKTMLKRIPCIHSPIEINSELNQLHQQKRILLSWGTSMLRELSIHPSRLKADGQFPKIAAFITQSLVAIDAALPATRLMYALSDFDPGFLTTLKFAPQSNKGAKASFFGLRGGAHVLLDQSDFTHIEIDALAKVHAKRIHLDIVLPFCRTPQELIALKRYLAAKQLVRGGYVRLFVRIETMAHLSNIADFLETGVDGVILDMHRLSMSFSGMNSHLSDHAPLKQVIYKDLSRQIQHFFIGISSKVPVYAWYHDYDIAYTDSLYPKRINAFIA